MSGRYVLTPMGPMQISEPQLTLKVFLHPGGKAPQRGKEGDAGLDVFARIPDSEYALLDGLGKRFWNIHPFQPYKIPLGFSYAFWVDGKVSHDYWLDIRNRSGVGTKEVFVTLAEVGDANYRGEIHYCVARVMPAFTGNACSQVSDEQKIAQALITPFVDPYKVNIELVGSVEELGPSQRGAQGFGDSGSR